MTPPDKPEPAPGACTCWIDRRLQGRPRVLHYTTLSICWIFPSLGAVWVLLPGCGRWFRSGSLVDGLLSIRVEEWAALVILFLHAFFIWRAVTTYRNDPLPEPAPDGDNS